MGLGQFATVADYVKTLRQTPAEVTALADDLLIHVTGFFRDPDAWAALQERVIGPLAADRPDGAEVRCWVTACATGEEAYTLAMLLTEAAEARGKRFDVKVFATDLAERALGAARDGVFPNGIESEVSPERLARFFDKDDSFYRVRKVLRELVIFAPQNLLQDPPFSRLDIATCRNLLIYLEPETQRRVLSLLHFGLREGGALMLGSSESAATADGDFEPIDKKHRIFRRIGPTRSGTVDLAALAAAARGPRPHPVPDGPRPPAPAAAQVVARALLDRHTPPAVAVNAAGQIVHVHGDTSPFLTFPAGVPTLDLLALANEQVRGAVRTALHRAADTHAPATVRDGLIDAPGGPRRVEVGAAPLGPRGAAPLYLVTFRDYPEPPPPGPATADPSAAGKLADELLWVRNELQGALDEMQASNEELKASHEETTSLNEELQSTNEELETSKEELQSLNEELVTVNAQLTAKMTELESAANDLGSLLTSTDIAVLFLDPRFRIRRYTPAVQDLLDLIPSDVGRPFADLRRKFTDPDLLADARAVLDRLVPVERAVQSESGRHYLRWVRPYRTQDNRIDGVVVAFVDVTTRKRAEEARRISEGRLRLALAAARMGIWTLEIDTGSQMRDANLNALLGLEPRQTTQPFEEFLTHVHPDDVPAVRAAFEASIREGRPLNVEFRIVRPGGAVRWLRDQGDVFGDAAVGASHMAGACIDVTERRQAEEGLRRSEERQRLILETATDFAILTLDSDRTVTSWSPGAAATFGYATDEMIGQSADALFTPEDRAAGVPGAEAAEARRAGRAADERWHLRKDGTRFYASGVMRPLRDGGGFLKVARDLTDRKRMEDELRTVQGQLEARVAERTADLERTLAALGAEMERRRDLARELATSQEDERRRVSRDLHDAVGQTLTALGLAAAAGEAARVRDLTDQLAREVHQVAVRLRPVALDDMGLDAALAELARQWSAASGVPVDLVTAGAGGDADADAELTGVGRLPAPVETAVYRLAQEALTNVARHARATRAGLSVTRTAGHVTVTVEDDGAGFAPAAPRAGRLGLLGMQERVAQVGGALEIESAPGRGTTVIARIPVGAAPT